MGVFSMFAVIILTTAATQQTFPQTPKQSLKTNMRHIHTSIVYRHLATRGNNKILRTPPPHISSSEERIPRLTRRTLAQLRPNKSPYLKSYLHKVDAKTHPSPLCPRCNIHTHDTHHLFNCTHIRTTLSPLDLWTDPAEVTALLARWTEKLAGGPQAGTSDSPALARVMGVGRQQQQMDYYSSHTKMEVHERYNPVLLIITYSVRTYFLERFHSQKTFLT